MKPRWQWQSLRELRSALRWPWDHTNGGKYAAKNDNGWVMVKAHRELGRSVRKAERYKQPPKKLADLLAGVPF